jgi:hypothetical protein
MFFNLAETVMGRLPVTRAQLLDPKGTRRNDAKNKGLIQNVHYFPSISRVKKS